MNENRLTRRNFQTRLGAIMTALFCMDALSAPLKEIPASQSLQAEISTALKKASPLLVFISLDNCLFCKIARENYLLPLMNEQAIPVVQVNFRYLLPATDARGHVTTQDQLVRAWGVKVAPTVLFLGQDGKELAPRLTGGSNSDFYGAYLEERIRTAQTAIARDLGKK
jgi:hypothetical protein